MTETLEVRYEPAADRDAEVAKLVDPWIGDEGPQDASLRRGRDSEPLRRRGMAFDASCTVVWDEDAVQVVRVGDLPEDSDDGSIVRKSPVIVREWFQGPEKLFRVDYLRAGVLIASRFVAESQGAVDA